MGRFSVKKITIRKLLFIKFSNKLALTALPLLEASGTYPSKH